MENEKTRKPESRNYFALSEVFGYYLRKPDPNRPNNFNIRAMHTINKISIVMFLIGLVMVIIKLTLR
jgi:hypothetical protein